jgi:PAS domain S-box-containing protein
MARADSHTDNSLFPKVPDGLFIDAVFSSIGEGAIATDEFGRIVRINYSALQLLGFNEQEVIGKWYPSVVVAIHENGSKVNLMDRSITKAFISGNPVIETTYYLTKKGDRLPVTITVSPVVISGRPIGAINLFRDITQEHEIDRMKSEFISLASHQLRTPLSAIKTYSHMLLEGFMGKLNKDQTQALESVVDASDRMVQLTDTLLNITRIESGSITISKSKVNLRAVAEKVIHEQLLDARSKDIVISIDSPDKPAIVNTDKFIVKEILTNIISNAIKYTPEKGKIILAIRPRKDEILCSVSDNGIGIPKAHQDQIFNKFYRAPNVLERDTTGTGLGLYLIKSLAERLNIPISFESTENKGTTFYFSLPAELPKSEKITTKTEGSKNNAKGKI